MVERLYGLYYEELTGWCAAMTQDRSMAEDLVQEGFLKALGSEDVLEGLQQSQCRAWLYRTIKNLYLDRLRHAKFETAVDQLPEEGRTASGYEEFHHNQLLLKLPPEERILFTMRYLQGYHSSELGTMFSMSPSTVRMKLASARKKLRKEWEE